MFRLFLYLIIGFILWRMVRAAMRVAQSPRSRDDDDAHVAPTPPRKKPDLSDIRDADFEDISDQPPPQSPPPKT